MSLEKIEAADAELDTRQFDVRRLRLAPGDIVVVTTAHKIPNLEAQIVGRMIQDGLARAGHRDNPVVVMVDGATLAVIDAAKSFSAETAANV